MLEQLKEIICHYVEVDQQTAAGIRTVQEAVDYLEKLTGEE